MDLKSKFRHVMDYPVEGIDFIDITTVLQDAQYFRHAVDSMIEKVSDIDFDIVVGTDARGFLFASPIAYRMGKGLALIRKKGKLPYKTVTEEYQLEYGADAMEMHEDAVEPGQKVLMVDDLLATGGTARAGIRLVEKLGGKVTGLIYLIELEYLNGREKINGYRVDSVVQF